MELYAWMFVPVAGVAGVRATGPNVKEVQFASLQVISQLPTYADSELGAVPLVGLMFTTLLVENRPA